MSKPMFFYAGVYGNLDDADADLAAIKELDDSGAIGSYDSAVITKKADGEVEVTKTEKPVEHGAWVGLAAGAGVAILCPVLIPAVIVAGAAGAGAGAWFAHLAHGTSRGELKRVGELLNPGDSAVVVIGIDKDAEQIEGAASHARDHLLKRSVGDWDAAEQDALEAVKAEEAKAVVAG